MDDSALSIALPSVAFPCFTFPSICKGGEQIYCKFSPRNQSHFVTVFDPSNFLYPSFLALSKQSKRPIFGLFHGPGQLQFCNSGTVETWLRILLTLESDMLFSRFFAPSTASGRIRSTSKEINMENKPVKCWSTIDWGCAIHQTVFSRDPMFFSEFGPHLAFYDKFDIFWPNFMYISKKKIIT